MEFWRVNSLKLNCKVILDMDFIYMMYCPRWNTIEETWDMKGDYVENELLRN